MDKTITYCDRCGDIIESYVKESMLFHYKTKHKILFKKDRWINSSNPKEYTICKNCAASFEKWLAAAYKGDSQNENN